VLEVREAARAHHRLHGAADEFTAHDHALRDVLYEPGALAGERRHRKPKPPVRVPSTLPRLLIKMLVAVHSRVIAASANWYICSAVRVICACVCAREEGSSAKHFSA